MTPAKRVMRDIETLQESLKMDWQDLATLELSQPERRDLRRHMKWCAAQLNYLVVQLEILENLDT